MSAYELPAAVVDELRRLEGVMIGDQVPLWQRALTTARCCAWCAA